MQLMKQAACALWQQQMQRQPVYPRELTGGNPTIFLPQIYLRPGIQEYRTL